MTEATDHAGAGAFALEDVVTSYGFRPDYPCGVYAQLLNLASARTRLLDIGCGPGKLAAGLATQFAEVVAVDPSAGMLRAARERYGAGHSHIAWVEATAEAVLLEGPFDLIVAGESVHWMDVPVVFPKLATALAPDAMLALVNGDGPSEADWMPEWQAVTADWIKRLGGEWNGAAYRSRISAHAPWLDLLGEATFEAEVVQSVDDLIEAQHSRSSWTRARLGEEVSAFRADLRRVLTPFAVDGEVRYRVRSSLRWGRPRLSPKVDRGI